MYLMILIFV